MRIIILIFGFIILFFNFQATASHIDKEKVLEALVEIHDGRNNPDSCDNMVTVYKALVDIKDKLRETSTAMGIGDRTRFDNSVYSAISSITDIEGKVWEAIRAIEYAKENMVKPAMRAVNSANVEHEEREQKLSQ